MIYGEPTIANIRYYYDQGKRDILLVVSRPWTMYLILEELGTTIPYSTTIPAHQLRQATVFDMTIRFAWDECHFLGIRTPDCILSAPDNILSPEVIDARDACHREMRRNLDDVLFNGGTYYRMRTSYLEGDQRIWGVQQEEPSQQEELSVRTFPTERKEVENTNIEDLYRAMDLIRRDNNIPTLTINGEEFEPVLMSENSYKYFHVGEDWLRVCKPKWNTKCLLCGADAYINNGPIECSKGCYSDNKE